MKNTENIFFASVIIGAVGLGLLLSPAPYVIGLWVIAFSEQAIRAGLVLINIQVRKVNQPQYWIVLAAAILGTCGTGAAIDSMIDRYSMEWWAGQTINFLILAGEYSWAIVKAGTPVDWEFEHKVLSGKLRKASEEVEKLREEVEDSRGVLVGTSLELEVASRELAAKSKELGVADAVLAKVGPVVESVKRLKNEKISVNRVGSIVCPSCSVIVAPPSNSHKPDTCPNCKEELRWKTD